MQINKMFRDNLIINYLTLLVINESYDEFLKFYLPNEKNIMKLALTSDDIDVLEKVNGIIDFRKKKMSVNRG